MKQLDPELLSRFYQRFPNTRQLRIVPIAAGTGCSELFDIEDVQGLLGEARFQKLMQQVKTVYSCGHRNHPVNHPDATLAGTEVHAIAAADLDKFLAEGN